MLTKILNIVVLVITMLCAGAVYAGDLQDGVAGTMYANGQGVVQDSAEAVKWYKLAAAQGHEEAQTNLVSKASSANQGAMPDKTTLLKFIFGKKWSLDDIPCNWNGGTYTEYTNKNKLGLIITINGSASKDSNQETSYTYEVTGDRTFIFSLNTYAKGNSSMETFMRDPNAIVSTMVKKVELISPKKIKFTNDIKAVDLMKLLKNIKVNSREIPYEVTHEESFSNLCAGL